MKTRSQNELLKMDAANFDANDDAESQPMMPSITLVGSDVVKMSENKDWLYWRGMAFFVCLLWSSQFPIIKHIFVLQPQLHASVYSAVRFTLASIILLPTYYSKLNDWNMIKGTLFVALSAVCAYVGQSVGMSMGTTADKSAFICSLTVVWVPLLQGALKRNFREQKWLPVILSIVGVAFLEL